MFNKITNLITNYIIKEIGNYSYRDKIRFAIEIIISTMISLCLSLIIAVILGLFKEVIIILLISSILKVFTGGIHFRTVPECSMFTALVANTSVLLTKCYKDILIENFTIFYSFSLSIVLISIILWAPIIISKKNKKPKPLKIKSIIIVILLSLFIIYTNFIYGPNYLQINIITGLLLNAFSINPLTYRLLKLYYSLKKGDKNNEKVPD